MDLNGNTIKIWDCISGSQKELKIRHISDCCSKREIHKSAGGYK